MAKEEYEYIDSEKLDKYIAYMYGFNSENRKKYQDYYERKRESAIMAGFEFDEQFSEEVENMLLGKNEEVNQKIIDYVVSLGIPDRIRYTSFQNLLEKMVVKSMSETDERAIKQIRENINSLSEDIKQIEISLFGSDENALRKALYSSLVSKVNLRPERVANAISKKELKLKDPYNA